MAMTTKPVFVDTVTQVPADWANALTTLLFDVFNQATTPAQARQALGVGALSTQDSGSVNISGGAIDNTPIGMTTPAQAKFTLASADFDPVADIDLVNQRFLMKTLGQTLTQYLKSGSLAQKLYVAAVDNTSSASVPNTGWVDTRTIDKIKDAPVSRKVLVVQDRKITWEGFPIDEPLPENFEITVLSNGATLPFNFFPDDAATAIGLDPKVVLASPGDGFRQLMPNNTPLTAEQPAYVSNTVASSAYKVYKKGPTITLVFANANYNNLPMEVRYHHNTYNYLTMAPAQVLPTGPLECVPAWSDPINTPMGYLEGNQGFNLISASHTVVRQAYLACIVKTGVLGDAVIDWETQWGPLKPEGAAHPPKLTKVSNTEVMLELPKAVEDHYFEGCFKIKLLVNGVQMGYTQWIVMSNMLQPNNFKDGKVTWGFDLPGQDSALDAVTDSGTPPTPAP